MRLLLAGCLYFVVFCSVFLFVGEDSPWLMPIGIALALGLPALLTGLLNPREPRRVKRSPAEPPPEVLHDPVLGDLHLDEEGEWWATTYNDVVLAVGEPDEQLLEHLRGLVRDFDRFRATVTAFLAAEAKAHPDMADEISALTLSSVRLMEPPANGMIDFDGPHEYRYWRCDYSDGKPASLGFDD
jgi:hypothetical protein